MIERPTRDSLKRAGVTLDDAAPVLRDYVRGDLMTRQELVDSSAIEAFACWLYVFVSPRGVVEWNRLTQSRRTQFVEGIRTGLAVALGKDTT